LEYESRQESPLDPTRDADQEASGS